MVAAAGITKRHGRSAAEYNNTWTAGTTARLRPSRSTSRLIGCALSAYHCKRFSRQCGNCIDNCYNKAIDEV